MASGGARGDGDERALFAPPADDSLSVMPTAAVQEAIDATASSDIAAIAEVESQLRPYASAVRKLRSLRESAESVGLGSHASAAALAELERGTGFLFVPVCLCTGALTYFSMSVEPGFAELLFMPVILGVGLALARERIVLRHLFLGLMLVALGMSAAKFETWRAATRMIGGEISTLVTGRVVRIEHQANSRVRLTIDVIETARPALRYSPDRIRVTARSIPETIVTGGGVSGVVRLRQPSGPVRPGSYDFSFSNYFDGIGASGFFLTAPLPAELSEPAPFGARVAALLERVRDALAARIRSRVGGPEGEIAAALVTGVTAGIPEKANEDMRLSGIYHVISISGLHLALVAGTVMVSMRAAFALFPGFASRRPVKKYAASIALLIVFFYLFLSGAEVATQRSFIMLAVMLLALIFDRAALTMRNLAIAAMIVIVISPHEVAGPSFQMSFAATAALIAVYAAWSERRRRSPPGAGSQRSLSAAGMLRLGLLYAGGIAVTSIVAGTATALFGAWHFNRVAPLGLIANLLAMPVVSLLVMPFAVLAMLLMPFGLDHLPLAVMGKGIAVMMSIAEWVAAQSPFDVVGIVPVGAVFFLSAALVLLTMSTTAIRLAAVPLLLAGALSLIARHPPDMMVAEDGRLVAMPLEDGRIAVNRARPNNFTIENWARALAATEIVKPDIEEAGETAVDFANAPVATGGFSCQAGLCLAWHRSGAIIAHATDGKLALPACGVASIVVIEDATAGNVCARKSVVITKRDAARRGSAEVRFNDNGAGIRATVIHAIAEPYRPWHSHRAFSREARGMPPYKRQEHKPRPAGDATIDAAAPLSGGTAQAAAAAEPIQ